MAKGGSQSSTTAQTLTPEHQQVLQAGMNHYMPGGALKPAPTAPGSSAIPGFNADHNKSFDMTRQAADGYKPAVDQSKNLIGQAGQNASNFQGSQVNPTTGWTKQPDGSMSFADYNGPGGVSRFMNPFTQYVVNSGMQELGRGMDMTRRNIGIDAAGQGAFGGGRHAIENAENNRNFFDKAGQFLSGTLSSGFDKATQQYNTAFGQGIQGMQQGATNALADSKLKLDAAAEGVKTANLEQQMAGRGANALYGVGEAERQLQMDKTNADYNSQLSEFFGPARTMQILTNAMPAPSTTTTSSSRPSMWQTAGNIASLAGSLAMLSDERAKTDITEVDPEGALDDIRKLIPYEYRYKDGIGDGKRRKGFMAQDAERAGIKTHDVGGLKAVDVQSTLEKLTHAVIALDRRHGGRKAHG